MVSKGISEELHTPFQLLEVSRGAQKLNQMINSWSKELSFDGQSKDIARDLLRGGLDLQESLIKLGKLQKSSKHIGQLKKKQKLKSEQDGRGGNEVGIERMDPNRFGDKNYQIGLQKPRLSADRSSRNCIEELKKVIRDSLSRQNLILDTSAEKKKEKGPSLIAKLMGLEEFPPEPLQLKLESEKILNQRRPIFDIDMPKARMPQFVDRNMDPERSTLKKILKTMQFKGLLKSNNVKGLKHTSSSKQRMDDEIPPIVIIKPLHFPCPQTEEPLLGRLIWGERALDSKVMIKKLETKEEPLAKKSIQEEGALDSKLMLRNLEAKKEPPTKRITREGVKDCKKILKKPDQKELKTKEKVSSNKMKASVPVNRKPQKKEASDKKVGKLQKVSPGRGKSVEKENLKSKIGSNSQDQATKLRKSENASIIATNSVSHLGSTTQNPIHRMKKQPTKKAKLVRESHSNSLVTENLGCEEDGKGVILTCALDSIFTRTNTLLSEKLLIEEGAKTSKIQIEVHRENSQNLLCEVTPQTNQHKRGIESAEEANQLTDHKTTEKSFVVETDLKGLLLSSPSFLIFAEELFDLKVNQSTVLQTNGIKDVKMVNTRLFLDCANEIMERKSLQTSRVDHSLLQTYLVNPTISISLDQLVEEVCDGIENLRSYSKLGGDEYPIDGLSIKLQRDLSCKGEVVNGIWDLGWRNRFSSEEADQVVDEVGKQVLNELIEEILTDTML
ncbi:hypothetical protein HHK36_025660 [Tetracentron sinense]|uniref:DUF4378 domain-containing protein n=1 Tax=Tetracentron sinense TaxID=13715 RepID=A0A834YKV1_TETSI|nr:hypothetical protein HHK36_025660 [Tetracentron sinense]